jgi:hypothetical protein
MLDLTITELEGAINRSIKAEPPRNCVLPPDLRALADLYGTMIFGHAQSVDIDQQPERIRLAVLKWLPAHPPIAPGAACLPSAYDPGIASAKHVSRRNVCSPLPRPLHSPASASATLVSEDTSWCHLR